MQLLVESKVWVLYHTERSSLTIDSFYIRILLGLTVVSYVVIMTGVLYHDGRSTDKSTIPLPMCFLVGTAREALTADTYP